MKNFTYQGQHWTAFVEDEHLLITYSPASPVHAGQTLAYGMADALPSGITAGSLILLLESARPKRRRLSA